MKALGPFAASILLLASPAFANDADPAPSGADAGAPTVEMVPAAAPALAPLPSPEPTPGPLPEAPPPSSASPTAVGTTSSRKLAPIVVTESKVSQPQDAVTQSVRVIDEDEIEQRPVNQRNLSELLRYEPGVFVSALSRNDANWGSYGGLGPKYNLYLLDGLPIDAFIDGMSIDPWALQRVESQRGPASVMYSNYLSSDFAGQQSPLAGVTNFVLRDKIDGQATRLRAGYGSYNTLEARGYNQGRAGNLSYFIGSSYERSDYTNYGTDPSWLNILQDPQYTKIKVYGKLSYFFGRDDHKVSLFVHHTTHDGNAGRYNRDFANAYDTINAVYSNQITSVLHAQLKVGLRAYDRRWGEDQYGQKDAAGALVPNQLALREHDGVKQRIVPADLTLNLKHFGESFLTFGVDGQLATYKTYAEPNGERTTQNDATAMSSGLFAQERVVMGPLTVRAGGRLAYLRNSFDRISGGEPGIDNQSWTKVLWSAGARFQALQELAVFANAGSSFVPPAAKSVAGTLLETDANVPGKNGQLPNRSLSPESGLGADLGFELRPLTIVSATFRGFYNEVSKQIIDQKVSADPSQSQSVNAGSSVSYGGELSIEATPIEQVTMFANGTYTHTKISNSTDTDQDGNQIPFVPNWMGNLGLTLRLPYRVTISPYLNRVGTYYDSSSTKDRVSFGRTTIWNLRAAKSWVGAGHTTELSVVLNNISNSKYRMPWQFRDPGFNAMGYLQVAM